MRPLALSFVALILVSLSGCQLVLRGMGLGMPEQSAWAEGDDEGECTDGEDNDANGLVDCDELLCAASPACDGNSLPDRPEVSARAERGAEQLGGTYAASCDRAGGTAITFDGDRCTFTVDGCGSPTTKECRMRRAGTLITVELGPPGEPSDELRMRVVDANTLAVDANQFATCACGRPPRLVFKRSR